MGKRRMHPVTVKKTYSGAYRGLHYAVASMQGWRLTMEDHHRVSLPLRGKMNKWGFAGVYDGHGGYKTSLYCSNNLHKKILKIIGTTKDMNGCTTVRSDEQKLTQAIKYSIVQGFLEIDESVQRSKTVDDFSGSTAVCTLVSPTKIFFANCGDSRAVLCRNGKVHFATKDHKPNRKVEKKRIKAAGGFVRRKRVIGRLAMSRAIGDFHYKENLRRSQCKQMVIPKPDVTVIERNNKEDEFLVLASDGIWDEISNPELVQYIKNQMCNTNDLKLICNKVLDHCLKKGSRDNMSIVLITLPGYKPIPREDLQRKRKLSVTGTSEGHVAKKAKTEKTRKKNCSVSKSARLTDRSKISTGKVKYNLANIGRVRKQTARPPNPYILYFMDYWKKNGGNVCKVAKDCGQRWNRFSVAEKRKYQRRFKRRQSRRDKKIHKQKFRQHGIVTG